VEVMSLAPIVSSGILFHVAETSKRLAPNVSSPHANRSLETAIDSIAPPGILIGHRLISQGDESALTPAELEPLRKSVVQVRRASGAARIVARNLMTRFGCPQCAVPKAPSGAPV
jgi:4'-phosphopantetheinyl transferase EntD